MCDVVLCSSAQDASSPESSDSGIQTDHAVLQHCGLSVRLSVRLSACFSLSTVIAAYKLTTLCYSIVVCPSVRLFVCLPVSA